MSLYKNLLAALSEEVDELPVVPVENAVRQIVNAAIKGSQITGGLAGDDYIATGARYITRCVLAAQTTQSETESIAQEVASSVTEEPVTA